MKIVTPKFIWLPAIIVLLVGFILDLTVLDSAFPRSGAVVVALSIPFFFWGRKRNDDYRANPVEKGLLELTEKDAQRFGESAPGSVRESLARSWKTLDDIVAADVGLAKAEVWTLVIGTLIWAFGDWVVNVFRCGELAC